MMRSFITCNLYQINQNDQVKKNEIGTAGSTNGVKRNAYRIRERKPEGKTSPGISKYRWPNNSKMVWNGFIWLTIDNSCEHNSEPLDSTKFGNS
jgi:hypothetical protein